MSRGTPAGGSPPRPSEPPAGPTTLRDRPLLVILLGALLLRAAWVTWSWAQSGPTLPYPDEELHWQLATHLVERGELVSDDGRRLARMPLYPLILAPFAAAGETGVLWARLAQVLLSTASVWIAARWTAAAAGRPAALLAGALLAIDPYQIFFCNLLLTETAYVTLSLAASYAVWRWMATPDRVPRPVIALAGLAASLALMTRPSAVLWVALLWLSPLPFDRPVQRYLWRAAGCGLLLIAIMLPWGLRNRAVAGDFAWLSANGGVTLYDAQGPQADGSGDQTFLQHMPELAGLSEIEQDRLLRARAVEQMTADPARVARLAVVKFQRLWNPFPNVAEHRAGPTAWASAIYTVAVLLLAAAALLRTGRRTARLQWLLWMPVVYFTLLHCIYIGSLRYRIPLMPLIAISAACVVATPARPRSANATDSAAPAG